MNIEDKEIKLALNAHTSPIRPPTPLTPSNSHRLNYTLFDTITNNDTWCSTQPLIRNKYTCVQSDNEFNQTMPLLQPLRFWRRSNNGNSICHGCMNQTNQIITSDCGHTFCHLCFNNSISQNACPICTSQQSYYMNPPQTNAATPSTTTSTLRNFVPNPPPAFPCVKLTNIPWDVSQNDVRHFFSNSRSPSISTCSQSIHIMMDRTTGKTLSDAYVEFLTVGDMRRAIETRHQKPLKGRIVSVSECTQEELLGVVFPKWRGTFYGTCAIPPASEVVKSMSTAAGGGNSGCCPPFITREEINSLLVVCKNYKLHFSRKCAERPFENIISVITKYPWHQTHLITTMHRDHIYEMLKLSIESLKTHLSKDYVQIDSTLLERLTRAGIMCPTFTERQKMTLLQTARIDCPPDIVSYLVMSNTIVAPPPGLATPHTNTVLGSAVATTTPMISPMTQPLPAPQQNEYWQRDLDDSSSISSIIRDIQQCIVDEKEALPPPPSQAHKPVLSPWAPSYSPKNDIWRMAPVESTHGSTKNLLTA